MWWKSGEQNATKAVQQAKNRVRNAMSVAMSVSHRMEPTPMLNTADKIGAGRALVREMPIQ